MPSFWSVNNPSSRPRFRNYDATILIGLFIFFRAVTLYGLFVVSGGKELASDIVFHEIIIGDPLGILKGTAIHIASYPPFQWVFEWPLFSFFSHYFSEMISYRLMMLTAEMTAFVTTIAVLKKVNLPRLMSWTILLLFIFSPHQYFASIFFIQEDVIAQLFMLLALLFLIQEKRTHCIVVLILGVLIAKLFFIIPLFYVILFQGNRKFSQRIADGILSLVPLIVVYVFIITQAFNNGGEVPIRDFTPDAKYAANFWVLLIGSDPDLLVYYKNISLLLTTVVQLILIAVFLYFSRNRQGTWHPAIMLLIPLSFFFATFYQHMPEYLLMLWPVAALLCTSVWQQVWLAFALSFAWVPRIFHGMSTVVAGFGSAAEARTEIVGPLVNFLNLDYTLFNHIALVLQTILYTLLVLSLCSLSRKAQLLYESN